MPKERVHIPFPVNGIDQSMPYGRQPELTCDDAMNVCGYTGGDGRLGGGQRDGYIRAFTSAAGSTAAPRVSGLGAAVRAFATNLDGLGRTQLVVEDWLGLGVPSGGVVTDLRGGYVAAIKPWPEEHATKTYVLSNVTKSGSGAQNAILAPVTINNYFGDAGVTIARLVSVAAATEAGDRMMIITNPTTNDVTVEMYATYTAAPANHLSDGVQGGNSAQLLITNHGPIVAASGDLREFACAYLHRVADNEFELRIDVVDVSTPSAPAVTRKTLGGITTTTEQDNTTAYTPTLRLVKTANGLVAEFKFPDQGISETLTWDDVPAFAANPTRWNGHRRAGWIFRNNTGVSARYCKSLTYRRYIQPQPTVLYECLGSTQIFGGGTWQVPDRWTAINLTPTAVSLQSGPYTTSVAKPAFPTVDKLKGVLTGSDERTDRTQLLVPSEYLVTAPAERPQVEVRFRDVDGTIDDSIGAAFRIEMGVETGGTTENLPRYEAVTVGCGSIPGAPAETTQSVTAPDTSAFTVDFQVVETVSGIDFTPGDPNPNGTNTMRFVGTSTGVIRAGSNPREWEIAGTFTVVNGSDESYATHPAGSYAAKLYVLANGTPREFITSPNTRETNNYAANWGGSGWFLWTAFTGVTTWGGTTGETVDSLSITQDATGWTAAWTGTASFASYPGSVYRNVITGRVTRVGAGGLSMLKVLPRRERSTHTVTANQTWLGRLDLVSVVGGTTSIIDSAIFDTAAYDTTRDQGTLAWNINDRIRFEDNQADDLIEIYYRGNKVLTLNAASYAGANTNAVGLVVEGDSDGTGKTAEAYGGWIIRPATTAAPPSSPGRTDVVVFTRDLIDVGTLGVTDLARVNEAVASTPPKGGLLGADVEVCSLVCTISGVTNWYSDSRNYNFAVDGERNRIIDPIDRKVTDWTAAGVGEMPEGCRLITAYRGSIILARPDANPSQWYMSATVGHNPDQSIGNEPRNWDYGGLPTATKAYTGSDPAIGRPGDAITALVAYNDQWVLFGCARSLYVLDNHPGFGGQIRKISDSTGMLGPRAWCFDETGNLYILGTGGLYVIPRGSYEYTNVSGRRLTRLLEQVDAEGSQVQMTYDGLNSFVNIYITPRDGTVGTHVRFDVRTNGLWKVQYPARFGPTAVLTISGAADEDRRYIIGCHDGYVRRPDSGATSDDGDAITTLVRMTPKVGGLNSRRLMLLELAGVLAPESGPVNWGLVKGDSAAEVGTVTAGNPILSRSGRWGVTNNRPTQPIVRMRESAAALQIVLYGDSATTRWRLEHITAVYDELGKKFT